MGSTNLICTNQRMDTNLYRLQIGGQFATISIILMSGLILFE